VGDRCRAENLGRKGGRKSCKGLQRAAKGCTLQGSKGQQGPQRTQTAEGSELRPSGASGRPRQGPFAAEHHHHTINVYKDTPLSRFHLQRYTPPRVLSQEFVREKLRGATKGREP